MFQVFDEMNANDEAKGTSTLGICNTMVEGKKVKQGGLITMGVPEEVLVDIFTGKKQPLLIILDKAEYEKLSNQ